MSPLLLTTAHHDVLVLGVGVPNDRGSSTGETRVIRKAYFEDPRYVPLIERAYVLWNELEARGDVTLLVRTGCLNLGPPEQTPDALDRTVRESDVAPVRDYLRAHLPTGDGALLRSRVCMYTNTPDEHFIIGTLREWPQVVVLGGFSGHGYKMASVIGEIAADLATSGRSAFDLGLFDPRRLG